MPRIEFYVLSSSDAIGRLRAACQLALKAWSAGLPVFVRGSDEAQCAELNELLWTFKAERFVPHDLHQDAPLSPVALGIDEAPSADQGVLINLGSSLSPHVARFSRIIEIVNQQPELLSACRENFRTYRQHGYDPQRVEL